MQWSALTGHTGGGIVDGEPFGLDWERKAGPQMFFRRRNRFSLLTLLLVFFGLKHLKAERLSDEEKEEFKAKRKLFRTKVREACAVWDEDLKSESTESATPDSEENR